MTDLKPVVIIAGPTAGGKSRLALDVAHAFAGTIINADSMQVYRELRVLTARPRPEDEKVAPHRLFGVLPAAEACSAGRWLRLAAGEIEIARGEGRLPVVTGGTGLYLKALTEGLAEVPDVPVEINAEVGRLYDAVGGDAFRAALAALDQEGAARLPAGDAQRLKRAMAVVKATGRPLAEWQRRQPDAPWVEARFGVIRLMPSREALYAAAEARFDAMMAAGALAEVKALLALDLDNGLPAMKALGVPELRRHLEGELTLAEAVQKAKQATRNFAKRQLTWMRNQMVADLEIGEAYGPAARDKTLAFVRDFLAATAPGR